MARRQISSYGTGNLDWSILSIEKQRVSNQNRINTCKIFTVYFSPGFHLQRRHIHLSAHTKHHSKSRQKSKRKTEVENPLYTSLWKHLAKACIEGIFHPCCPLWVLSAFRGVLCDSWRRCDIYHTNRPIAWHVIRMSRDTVYSKMIKFECCMIYCRTFGSFLPRSWYISYVKPSM